MTEPLWIPLAAAITIHDRQISRHGGAAGMRDIGLLEAALARPINKLSHGATDPFELAATYGFGIAKADAFVGGNKRTALVCALSFLLANGTHVLWETDKAVRAIEDVARGAMTEAEFAEWLRDGAL